MITVTVTAVVSITVQLHHQAADNNSHRSISRSVFRSAISCFVFALSWCQTGSTSKCITRSKFFVTAVSTFISSVSSYKQKKRPVRLTKIFLVNFKHHYLIADLTDKSAYIQWTKHAKTNFLSRWCSSVVETSVFGRRTSPAPHPIHGWHVPTLWKVSTMGKPTRPTQPSIPSGLVNE